MKNILVEFGEYGARIYKDPEIIEQKKHLPNCFINPDTTAVLGISPIYWQVDSYGKIVRCSEEDMIRRNDHHSTIVTGEVQSLENVNINDLRKEFNETFDGKTETLLQEINRLKQEIGQSKEHNAEAIEKLNKHQNIMIFMQDIIAQNEKKHQSNHIKVVAAIVLSLVFSGLVFYYFRRV